MLSTFATAVVVLFLCSPTSEIFGLERFITFTNALHSDTGTPQYFMSALPLVEELVGHQRGGLQDTRVLILSDHGGMVAA